MNNDNDPKSRIDPQLAAALAKNQALAAEVAARLGPQRPDPASAREHAAQGRLWWNEGGPAMAIEREDTIPGPTRPIPVVLYKPDTRAGLPVMVYLHGGGYRIGNAHSNDRQMREIAAAWGGAIVSMDYAHVPEAVFPAAVNEAVAVYEWLAKNGAQWGVDGSRLAFAGSSAGANVAAGAAISAIAAGGIASGFIRAGVTIVGVFDNDTETESMREFDGKGLFPNRAGVIDTLAGYAPEAATRIDPRIDLTRADPARFPPMYIACAELDTLRDSSKNLAAHLARAGRPHTLTVYPGMTHLFFGFSRMVDRAAQCARDIAGFLARELPPG